MPLPAVIEIVPLDKPVHAEITVPGSKSITNRALILAALAEGETTLQGALWSEDTQVMVESLQELGFMVNVATDAHEACNRIITVYGLGGKVPRGGTEAQPLELFVGNAGTVARFLTAMVCLGEGVYRLHGAPRMHDRPQAALFQALRQLGYRIDSANDRLPALIYGGGPKPGAHCAVSIEESSQFASALLLGTKAGGWKIQVTGQNAEESPYVEMTRKLIKAFARHAGRFTIEPDASSGSYFIGASWLLLRGASNVTQGVLMKPPLSQAQILAWLTENSTSVAHWPVSNWQVDSQFPLFLSFPARVSRRTELGDSIMTMIVLAPFAGNVVEFTNLARMRVQECERVIALRTELTECGAKVLEFDDTLQVFPSALHGAEIETYNDHRMAMCFAILGLKVPGIKIKNPSCVKKTFPNFFQKLAAPPPHGLGAIILDAPTGRRLASEKLFAE
jgi:3-phosphoshikimate 1-carboxyvinyltransferase